MKILTVDDQAENQYVSKLILEHAGYEVMQASNGIEALEKMASASPDLIIADILMPKMDGFQFCRKVKENEVFKNIPFIFLTGQYTDPRDEEFARNIGADLFLRRPITPDMLLNAIEDTLKLPKKRPIKSPLSPIEKIYEEKVYLDTHVERLVNKLEEKVRALEAALEDVAQEKKHLEIRVEERTKDLEYAVQKLERLNKAANEAKTQDEALLSSIGEGVIALDMEGRIILINRLAESMLGSNGRSWIGEKFFETTHVQGMNGAPLVLEERPSFIALKSGAPVSAVLNFLRNNGARLPVAVVATPVILDGAVTGAVIVFRDITREQEIEKLRIDFLTIASHQLRTPLSGTKWLIETLKRGVAGKITKRQKEYLDQIYSINERMIKLVFDMLNVLHLESGALEIKKKRVSAAKMFGKPSKGIVAAAKERQIKLRSTWDCDECMIDTDPELFQNILDSLFSNAVNYSLPGQEVVFGITEEADATTFSLKDSGIGIPKDEQKRIFERFFRAANAKELKPEGTGLGLYIASILAEKIGATISFESEEGKGSMFYVRISKNSEQTPPLQR